MGVYTQESPGENDAPGTEPRPCSALAGPALSFAGRPIILFRLEGAHFISIGGIRMRDLGALLQEDGGVLLRE